jgi:hypothetical protein
MARSRGLGDVYKRQAQHEASQDAQSTVRIYLAVCVCVLSAGDRCT